MRRSIVMVSVVLGCARTEPPTQNTASAKTEAPSVEVIQLSRVPLETTLKLPGELTPYEAVDIYSRVAGIVSTISVDRGSSVRKGDVLVRLSAPDLAAQRAEADAKASAAATTNIRLQEASQTEGAVAPHEVELARISMEAEHAHAASLQALESFTVIRAPFAGVITTRNVHPGALVAPADKTPIVRLEDVARLRLTVAVPEQALGSVALGSTPSFTVSAYPGAHFSGKVVRKAASVETTTRTMPVEMDIANDDGRLAPGAYAEVEWPVKHEATLLVPRTAIVQTTARVFVVCVREDKAVRVDVRRGISRGNDVEIFGALAAGDVVVKRASEDMLDGAAVHAAIAQAGAAKPH